MRQAVVVVLTVSSETTQAEWTDDADNFDVELSESVESRLLDVVTERPERSRQRVRVLAFRRRVLAALAGFLFSTVILGSVPGLHALWWAAVADGVTLALYVAVLVHARNVAARHEWDLARRARERSQAWLAQADDVTEAAAERSEPSASSNQVLDRWALVPFMLACLAGSVLTPFVTVSRWFARTDLAFAKAWAERVAGLQTSLRQRSRRALTVSVAATVGVTGFGSLLNVALAQPASAAPAAAAPAPLRVATALSDVTPASASVLAEPADPHYQVVRGDTLWGISKQFYGNGVRWPDIAHANTVIANPNLIYPGQSFVIPGGPAPAAEAGQNAPDTPAIGTQPQVPPSSQIQSEASGQLEAAPRLRSTHNQARPGQVPAGAQQAYPAPARPQAPTAGAASTQAQSNTDGSVPLATQNPGARNGVSLDQIWACIRMHESGGDYGDTSGGGYYGAYQFLPSTWNSAMMALGLRQYANGRADLAPAWAQDRAAQWLQARSGWGQWPVASRLCGAN